MSGGTAEAGPGGGPRLRAPGGKGKNQAVAAAWLGQRAAMVGRVGADGAGWTRVAALRRHCVDTTHADVLRVARVTLLQLEIAPAAAVEGAVVVEGDSLCGALADALVRGEALGAAVRWAVRADALTTTRMGAQLSLPTRVEVEAHVR